MLQLIDVSKSFGKGSARTLAVDEVSLEVPRGQFCVLLGPSGAGKSTLLKMIGGVIEPTHGKVHVNGTPLTSRSRRGIQQQIGTIHQQFQLVSRLSVLDNVLCGVASQVSTWRALMKWFPAESRRRACEHLEEVALEPIHLYRKAAQLSGGQQQRVAIARAFIRSPQLVLADEPIASLDPSSSRAILTLLRNASRRTGSTVLCSLHQIPFALEFADRLVAMRDGRVVFDASPDDVTPQSLERIYSESDHQDTPHHDGDTSTKASATQLIPRGRGADAIDHSPKLGEIV